MSQLLENTRIGVHKKVAHLSYARLKMTPEQRSWRWTEIATEISKTLNVFCQLVPDSEVSNHFRKITFRPVNEVIASTPEE